MPVKRKANAPLKVPCTEDLYWKLQIEGGYKRKSVADFALYCLEEATKTTQLEPKKKKPKKSDV